MLLYAALLAILVRLGPSLLATPPAHEASRPRLAACTVGEQALRAAPKGLVQSQVGHGTPVWILQKNGLWIRIRTPRGISGYLPGKALRMASATARPVTCVRALGGLRLRAGPGTSFRVLEVMKPATPLEVLTREAEWIRVRTPQGREGFAASRWIYWPPLDAAAIP